MEPTCPAGSYVQLREVPNWRDYLGYGNIFVLFLKDGRRIIKEVTKSEIDPNKFVLCISHNAKYPSEELPRSMITAVFKVIKILSSRDW